MSRLRAVGELTRVRFLRFIREKESVFWVFLFPLLLALVLEPFRTLILLNAVVHAIYVLIHKAVAVPTPIAIQVAHAVAISDRPLREHGPGDQRRQQKHTHQTTQYNKPLFHYKFSFNPVVDTLGFAWTLVQR